MSLVKIGAIALVMLGTSLISAGIAHADVTLYVDASDAVQLLDCANEAGVGSELDLGPGGGTITVSDSVNAKLKEHHCI